MMPPTLARDTANRQRHWRRSANLHWRRSANLLAAWFVLLALPFAVPRVVFAQSACAGHDMLEEMRVADPPTFQRITQAAAATENSNAILWKIEQQDKPASYLFGTMHVTDERINVLPSAVKTALANSRRVALEIDDFSQERMSEAMSAAGKLMLLPAATRLDALLSDEEFAKVTSLFRRTGLPSELAIRLRPWVAVMLLSLSDCEKGRVANGVLPLDARLAQFAEARGVGVFGLETVERQFQALAAVPEDDQLAILKATLKLYDRIDDLMETTIQLYLKRQIGAIWPLQLALAERLGHSPQIFESFAQNLIVARNIKMRDRALGHLAGGGIFIAVGALHLPGKQGLVELIREAGYSVTSIE
jgi:uncharacterized protein YbaP (TraB family)